MDPVDIVLFYIFSKVCKVSHFFSSLVSVSFNYEIKATEYEKKRYIKENKGGEGQLGDCRP